MKTVFIVNPKSGSGKKLNTIVDELEKLRRQIAEDVEVYFTKFSSDAKEYVSNYCREKGPARFIACGGDGTFNEVLNGVIDFEDAQIGVVPIGTGNDFCRNFLNGVNFFDLEKQVSAKSVKCDAIKYITNVNGEEKTGYCANMFNVGFDCAVADMTNTLKEKTILSGTFSYLFSIFANLINKKSSHIDIDIDDKCRHRGELLLTSIANGSFCGGGLKTNPLACVTDGFININIVKNISRLRFLTLLPKYINGTYLKMPNIEKIVSSEKCRKVKINSLKGNIRISIDGEISDAGVTEFEIVPKAFNFVVPCYDAFEIDNEKIEKAILV